MRFGLPLIGVSPRHYGDIGRAAEVAGFESVWVADHLVLPARIPASYPYAETGVSMLEPGTPLYDPWVALAAVGSVTTNIRLATGVLILPLRHPFVTARAIVTLERLCGGRVTVGVGMGWLREEFELSGQSFEDRGRRGNEIIGLMRRLWTESEIEHHGEFFDFPPLRFEPKPLQKPTPPIEIGGSSVAALRRVAMHGDGWIAIGTDTIEEVAAKVSTLREICDRIGRDFHELSITISGAVTPDVETMQTAEKIGVTRIIVDREAIPGSSVNEIEASIHAFADHFINCF